jgi:hypothetical protein
MSGRIGGLVGRNRSGESRIREPEGWFGGRREARRDLSLGG